MKRRDFLKNLGLSVATLACPGCLFAASKDKPSRFRNVLLYVVDDQGTTDAGCYGNKVIKTPGLDVLASEGTRFTNAFCTTASCSPSRSVILTGLHNHTTGQYGLGHRKHHFASFDDIKSLPLHLSQAGYKTASIGKYHVAPEKNYHFQKYLPGGTPQQMATTCKSFITEDAESPFFIYFCTHEPHRPFTRDGSDVIDPEDVIVPEFLTDTPECREELAYYYMSIQRADSGLLKMIEVLKQTGHWEDTLIIYVSDNGMAFPGAKTTLYEPGMRLPCVVRNPEQRKKAVVCNGMTSWVDIAPTILDFAGIEHKELGLHGRSVLPILEKENPTGRDEVYGSHSFHEVTMYYPMRVVRQRQYKLIWNIAYKLEYPFANDLFRSSTWQSTLKRGDKSFGKRRIKDFLYRAEFELYDLKKDPGELNNLSGDTKYAKILEGLKQKLKKFQQDTGDPWLVKWEHE